MSERRDVENDEELQRFFSFEAMGRAGFSPGTGIVRGFVKVNGVAKAGAEVSIENTDKSLVTGRQSFVYTDGQGALMCRVEYDGYTEQLLSETLQAGVRKRVSVTLQPLLEGVFTVGNEKTEAAECPPYRRQPEAAICNKE